MRGRTSISLAANEAPGVFAEQRDLLGAAGPPRSRPAGGGAARRCIRRRDPAAGEHEKSDGGKARNANNSCCFQGVGTLHGMLLSYVSGPYGVWEEGGPDLK